MTDKNLSVLLMRKIDDKIISRIPGDWTRVFSLVKLINGKIRGPEGPLIKVWVWLKITRQTPGYCLLNLMVFRKPSSPAICR
jgi:hypothetical protein